MLAYVRKLLVELKNHAKGQESLIAQRTCEMAASPAKLQSTPLDAFETFVTNR